MPLLLKFSFRASPEEVKFIMVDPKRVELTQYNGIPHLLTPVIVDPEKVVAALGWAVHEMETRYKLFAEVGVRNIESYNNMSGFQALPYIIVIIDELADVMFLLPVKLKIPSLAWLKWLVPSEFISCSPPNAHRLMS
jgi:DNA segregation ATPase FtsK/SpoIIIE, S-DNA-T family